ncbi:ribosomal-protein-alanine N-acetyltransferase [Chitinophaga sp. CF118]|uniref:GNAT family N-acetyltransferase n=1 Tax=Chitinophaga sp. CF118 TaxID=1884367 RepID=UPI0008EE3A55|nr:GNAT family protein [Chitinophaga sp. CF118]SFD85283.1 ribosomal-protein-alanine N-acetyltransferase [Chitinophaga sp. CF118]
MEVPTLTTQNLVLRPIIEKDIAALFALFSCEPVMKFMDVERFTNVSEAAQMVTFFRDKLESGEGIRWAICLKASDELIGTCGYHHISKTNYKAEIGYDLLPDWWGKGIMTHSIHRLLKYGFEQMQLNRIEAIVDPVNTLSYKLLDRLGFQREGLHRQSFFEKGRFIDVYIYSMLQGDYKNEIHF